MSDPISQEQLARRVEAIEWFHRIELPGGVVTPGKIDPSPRLPGLRLPDDLSGRTLLDIGAWDGFFSFAMEARGAKVTAMDSFCWSGEGWGSKAGFDCAREALGSKARSVEMEVLDLSPEKLGTFDIVLFLNVLYHMRHPALAIERVASVTGELLVLETHTDLLDVSDPAIALYDEGELWQDETSYCGPNLPALDLMLRNAGFARIEVIGETPVHRRMARALLHERLHGIPRARSMQQGWVVIHASR